MAKNFDGIAKGFRKVLKECDARRKQLVKENQKLERKSTVLAERLGGNILEEMLLDKLQGNVGSFLGEEEGLDERLETT